MFVASHDPLNVDHGNEVFNKFGGLDGEVPDSYPPLCPVARFANARNKGEDEKENGKEKKIGTEAQQVRIAHLPHHDGNEEADDSIGDLAKERLMDIAIEGAV